MKPDLSDRVTTDAVAVLEGMYAAETQYLTAGGPGKASFKSLAPFFAPDVVVAPGRSPALRGRGHQGVERFFVAMSQTWESFEMVEQTYLATEGTVVVLTQVHARARATSQELNFPILQTVTVEEGRITEVRPFYWDTAAIATACGGPERHP